MEIVDQTDGLGQHVLLEGLDLAVETLAGIVSGMSPKGRFDEAIAEDIIETAQRFTAEPPGTVTTHHVPSRPGRRKRSRRRSTVWPD